MYTFSDNIQRSAPDLDQASLGSEACEDREGERERERGGGGGIKRLGRAHFSLQILVLVRVFPFYIRLDLLSSMLTMSLHVPGESLDSNWVVGQSLKL